MGVLVARGADQVVGGAELSVHLLTAEGAEGAGDFPSPVAHEFISRACLCDEISPNTPKCQRSAASRLGNVERFQEGSVLSAGGKLPRSPHPGPTCSPPPPAECLARGLSSVWLLLSCVLHSKPVCASNGLP